MNHSEATADIATRDCPSCPICGTPGTLIHIDMVDRLFHVPGKWSSRKCDNAGCGLIWLDPMPLKEEIHKAYAIYYTHEDKGKSASARKKKSWRVHLLRFHKRLLKALVGTRREEENHYLMYLRDLRPGRLLEIGCGNGRRLARLAALGWTVEGQEVDEKAWSAARAKYAFQVHLGELETLDLATNSFDAVVMNHVIEHVNAPAELLAEARRLLKPGGVLIVVTPNAESQEHSIFGPSWFSLDPPRHLQLFTSRALASLAMQAEFTGQETWTTNVNADYVAASSLKIRNMGDMKAEEDPIAKEKRLIAGLYFQLWATHARTSLPDNGEECVLRAIK
jgi:2-polyprenyl-3-methyl-5-hydroxy-6-metoxy-1,4-benzoquinol methylase